MRKSITFVLELLRLVVLLLLTLYVLSILEKNLIKIITGRTDIYWSMTIGNIFIFFLLYRNYFQFHGWYRREQNVKLSRMTSTIFIMISISLIIGPILLNIK